MLAARGFFKSTRISNRFFAKKSVKNLTNDDVDVLTNPSDEYVDSFMKYHGNGRAVFKREDLAQWRDSFPDYKFKVISLKGAPRVIATAHLCTFRPIDPSINKSIMFMGFGWIDPGFRSPGTAKLQNDMCRVEMDREDDNIVSQINQPAKNFWHKLSKRKEFLDLGHKAGDVGYKTFYSAHDVVLPENLDLSGITVKNAREVPKRDIINYDQTIHPYHREKYIISHMYDRDGFGKVAYDEEGNVIGIGQAVIYENRKDCNLGPIYAENTRVAQAMFAEILKDIKASEKTVVSFEVRSGQLNKDSFW